MDREERWLEEEVRERSNVPVYGYKVGHLRVINGTPQIVSHDLHMPYKIDATAECMTCNHSDLEIDCACGFYFYKNQESAEKEVRPNFQNVMLKIVGSGTHLTYGSVYRSSHQRIESVTVTGCFVPTCTEIPTALLEDDGGWLNGVCIDHSAGADPMKLWTLGAVTESLSSNNSVRRQVKVLGVLSKPGIETLQTQQVRTGERVSKRRRRKVITKVILTLASIALIILMIGVF